MLEMDGITATKVIRQLEPEKGPRIVAITAFLWKATGRSVLSRTDDCISKLVKLEDLKEALERFRRPAQTVRN
jgi:CheY-like chemotaxis protein